MNIDTQLICLLLQRGKAKAEMAMNQSSYAEAFRLLNESVSAALFFLGNDAQRAPDDVQPDYIGDTLPGYDDLADFMGVNC